MLIPCVSAYLGVAVGLDAHVETRPVRSGGCRVGPQVDNDGSGGIEPLQRALRAAEIDLLHVSAVRLVAQAAAGRVQGVKTTAHFQNDKAVRFRRAYGRDLMILRLSGRPTEQLSANKSFTLDRCGGFVSDVPR